VHSKPADWPSEKIGYLLNAPQALVKGLEKIWVRFIQGRLNVTHLKRVGQAQIRREQLDGVVQDRRLQLPSGGRPQRNSLLIFFKG